MIFHTSQITFSIMGSDTSISKSPEHSFNRRLQSSCRCRRTHHTDHSLFITQCQTPCPPYFGLTRLFIMAMKTVETSTFRRLHDLQQLDMESPGPELILLGCLLALPTLDVDSSELTIHLHSAVCF